MVVCYIVSFSTFTKFQKFSKLSVISSILHKYNNSNLHDVMIQTRKVLIISQFQIEKSRTKLLFQDHRKQVHCGVLTLVKVLLPYIMKQTALALLPSTLVPAPQGGTKQSQGQVGLLEDSLWNMSTALFLQIRGDVPSGLGEEVGYKC